MTYMGDLSGKNYRPHPSFSCHVTVYICRNGNSKQPFGAQWILEQYSLLPHSVTFTTLGWTTNLPVNFKGNY